jgi:hypothetical protein
MMAQLYAICRDLNNALTVKHVQLTVGLQGQLDGVFIAQKLSFMAGVNTDIVFTGDWKPDDDEVLVLQNLPEVTALFAAANQNAVSLPVLNVGNLQNEGVKGLFTAIGQGPTMELAIQLFSVQQLLSDKFSVLHDGNVFRRITEPAFALGSSLAALANQAGELRFKSYSIIRRILDLTPSFRAATDAELSAFCVHASLNLADANSFMTNADEGIRKHVLAVAKAGVLDNHTVANLEAQAVAIGFPITVNGGKLDVPMDRRNAKQFLSFLLNKVYQGPISQQLLITNSNRPL